jgi:4-methylaminobutanoate oxidase (formaldehyde-forming)
MTTPLPAAAQVVVIGGGIIGCSTAYHLARMGCRDVVLLERRKLTCGTTWHSAAQVRPLRSTRNLTELIRYSVELYTELEAETGQATGWLRTGSLSLATSPGRLTHIKRQAALARAFGVEAEVIGPDEARALWPLMNTDDVIGAAYSPGDGRVDPSDLCQALVKGAKARGATVLEDTPVTGFRVENGRISGVETAAGVIQCQAVVNCAGLWGRQVAELAGVSAPLYACEHFYLLTKPIAGVDAHLPTLGDHDGHLYFRDEVGGLLAGCFEPKAKPLALGDLPRDFEFDLLNEDWDHFEPMMINAMHRIPALETAEPHMLLNGPESFTPDGMFLMGESPELPGFFLCCGLNSVGVASGGGAGRAIAEWVVDGHPAADLWPADIRRFAPFHNNLRALRERAPEVLVMHYAIAYPDREDETARNLRLSPLHGRLAAKGARFTCRMGWERPKWFKPEGAEVDESLTFGRPGWFDLVAAGRGGRRRGRDAAALRQRHGGGAGAHDLYADAERARRLRKRPHGDAPGRRVVPGDHRHRAADQGQRVDPAAHRGRRTDRGQRRDLGVGGDRCHGPALPGAAVAGDNRGPLGRNLPLFHLADHRGRIRDGAGGAALLCGRTGLGALRGDGIRRRALRRVVGGRGRPRAPGRRGGGADVAEGGEGVSRLGP